MSTLFHSARKLDASGQIDDFWMLVDDGIIVSTGSGPERPAAAAEVDAAGQWLTPGFIDLHGHGGGGYAYDRGPEQLLAALETHRAHGTTRSVLSLVAAPLPSLIESLDLIADLSKDDPLVLGSHLEGPYLAPAHRGAHDPTALHEPDPAEVEQLISASRGTLRQVTLATELPNALETVDVLVEAGIVAALGHTDATFEMAKVAFDRGVRLLTHAFNAMPGIHHRSPGPVVAAFEDERVVLELVCDGVHVHPEVVNLTFASAAGRIALITDSMAAAGAADGNYRLGNLNVTVQNGLAVLSGTNTIAGSTLTQDAALGCAIASGVDPAKAVEALTHTPARVLGLEHRHGMLAPGFAADAVLLDHEWAATSVWADGLQL
ncbi:N-acetylglucosamine-6-phosphate deacetylase [Leifsonia sp. AK011]|uniref:N-acetylglucosamine-6-phosphate deacetylase n=1 Tax=Leifsonia sp. AK011 TaxID=2723075 RepID=UPI0015CDFE6A|nr:N-acetylglucosamine-6-phosphate deacetylase [Leifsonia sp. AK011]NYF09728.1 N-acetylglucosamine-6-phosphate deacetylase [Leifsonia sp. AK011]